MKSTKYAYLGTFGMGNIGEMGLNVYEYDEADGGIRFIQNYLPDFSVGQQAYNRDADVLYIVNEVGDLEGHRGAGGEVAAFRRDTATGELHLIDRRRTYGIKPCYVTLDAANQFLLISHHGTRNYATQMQWNEDGSVDTRVTYDSASLALFSLNEDGSIGEFCDAYEFFGYADREYPFCHLHSVIASPDGNWFIVSDKGQDCIYTFQINRKERKLVLKSTLQVEAHTAPRYGVFHPTLPIFYGNREQNTQMYAYDLNTETGELTIRQSCPLLETDEKGSPSDIAFDPGFRHMYVNVRHPAVISVLSLDEEGGMKLQQVVGDDLDNPRGMVVSPDEKYIICTNNTKEGGHLVYYTILEDGKLQYDHTIELRSNTGNLQII